MTSSQICHVTFGKPMRIYLAPAKHESQHYLPVFAQSYIKFLLLTWKHDILESQINVIWQAHVNWLTKTPNMEACQYNHSLHWMILIKADFNLWSMSFPPKNIQHSNEFNWFAHTLNTKSEDAWLWFYETSPWFTKSYLFENMCMFLGCLYGPF